MREGLQVFFIECPLLLLLGVVEPALQVVRPIGVVLILMIRSFRRILRPVSILVLLHDYIVISEAGEHPRFHAVIHGVALCQGIKISSTGVFIAHHQRWLRLPLHIAVTKLFIRICLSIFILICQLVSLPLLALFVFELLKCGLKGLLQALPLVLVVVQRLRLLQGTLQVALEAILGLMMKQLRDHRLLLGLGEVGKSMKFLFGGATSRSAVSITIKL